MNRTGNKANCEKEKRYSDDLLTAKEIRCNYKNFIKEWEESSLFKTQ